MPATNQYEVKDNFTHCMFNDRTTQVCCSMNEPVQLSNLQNPYMLEKPLWSRWHSIIFFKFQVSAFMHQVSYHVILVKLKFPASSLDESGQNNYQRKQVQSI